MGISTNSHGKKLDKETQSPLLKIFKEVMTREKDENDRSEVTDIVSLFQSSDICDPEKKNLLIKQKEDNKKRRQYSGSRIKVDRPERRPCESSSSEHRKRAQKNSSTEQRADFNRQPRTQSVPYQSENKESWWFWQKDQNEKKPTEETCSCVSCALKRLVSSEYACIGCLLILFTISIIVAFLVVFKSVPTLATSSDPTPPECKKYKTAESERLKRKIEKLNENRLKNDLADLDEIRKNDKQGYDDELMGHSGVPGAAGMDFGPSFRELNSLDESESKVSGDVDWSSLLENDKPNDMQSSERLREFYKKLVQTDAKIKDLKKNSQGSFLENDGGILESPDRSKRSLKLYSYPKKYVIRRRRSAFGKDNKRKLNDKRMRRHGDDSEEPTGFVIEKKKLIVQYKPSGLRKKVPKCSHAPKDSHTHENQLKHPFYQNTQRLDELLDRFLNKNLPEIMSDPFGLDMLFQPKKLNKCKHPTPSKNIDIINKDTRVDNSKDTLIDQSKDMRIDQIPKPKIKINKVKEKNKSQLLFNSDSPEDILKLLKPETSTQYETDFYNHEEQMIGKEKEKFVTSSPNNFEVLLSVSTIMNPPLKKFEKKVSANVMLESIPKLRRLMQMDSEDDENLGYEDVKEVLTDDMENHDDMEKRGDRKKRMNEGVPGEKIPKINPPGVNNPNWKGPIPLYPEELSSMIKQAVLNANKMSLPSDTLKSEVFKLQRKGRDVSDVEYVEDYLSNKFDNLVEMAQAYSDYGVLDGKKETRNENNSASGVTAPEHRVKLAAKENFFKAGLLGRLKKDRTPKSVSTTTRSIRRQRDLSTDDNQDIAITEQTGGVPNTFLYKTPSEGIRFELRPTTKARDDDFEVRKLLGKHVKIGPIYQNSMPKNLIKPYGVHPTLISTYPDVELVYIMQDKLKPIEVKTSKADNEEVEQNNGLIFAMKNGFRRNLLSTDFKRSDNLRIDKEPTGHKSRKNKNGIFKFFHYLNFERHNLNNAKALVRCIERTKHKNIRIYSTAHPSSSSSFAATETLDYLGILPTYRLFNAGNANFTSDLKDTIVTINGCKMKLDEYTGNNFLGKIFLTVKNPDIGLENIHRNFYVPLVINFNNERKIMTDSLTFPNSYNQFEIFTEPPVEQTQNNMETFLGSDEGFENKTFGKRVKKYVDLFENPSTSKPEVEAVPFSIDRIPAINMTSNSTTMNNVTMRNVHSANSTESEMTLSDFFTMVSDWFKALEGVKVDKPQDNSGSDLTEMLLKLNNTGTENNVSTTTDTAYPNYDSDMIENIGHRSRVLLSFENVAPNKTVLITEKDPPGDKNCTNTKEISAGNASSTTNLTKPATDAKCKNATTPKREADTKTNASKGNDKKPKAIFKRNADDSNLIFWNDIYDDEYGIQTDKLDSVKNNDIFKRSGRWVHDKIKKFAENLKIKPRSEDMEIKERIPRSIRSPRFSTYPKYIYKKIHHRIGRRHSDSKDEDEFVGESKTIFTALSANMNEVCEKAAKAVLQTRNIEVRENSKHDSIATSLMQQLVRLLTDLVDYQVKQKTCTKLPPDLQSFLEWLTYPKEATQEQQPETIAFKTPYKEEDLINTLELQNTDDKSTEHSSDYATQASNEIQGTVDVRIDYLDCIHCVQDLMEQYKAMSDDEKSKMTGVQSYLDNQMRYLNRQISVYDSFSPFEKRSQMRYKRDLDKNKLLQKGRPRRRLNKFIKKFGKKHTRTTAGFYDEARGVTDMRRHVAKNANIVDTKADQDFEDKYTKDVKRNLKDVYYKAVAEAKKYTTGKSVHKKEMITHSFASTTTHQ